jgi:beta-glucosidase
MPIMEFETTFYQKFPKDFRWGTATAAYQIEGAVSEDGRGPSIWDTFSHTPGKTLHAENGDVACDHYHRFDQDFDLLLSLGITDYRLSTAWSRIYPQGHGRSNPQGVAFYDRLIDALLERGITPAVTLYHWDLPEALEASGGWRSRDTAFYFRDYAAFMFQKYGDRVKLWITHNEPWCTTFLGHLMGEHAPGLRDAKMARAAGHHVLLSHGLAVDAFRGLSNVGEIGITLNLNTVYANSDSDADQGAQDWADTMSNRIFLDPLFKGQYAALTDAIVAPADPDLIRSDDMAVISRPIDFLGVNYYSYSVVAGDPAAITTAGVRDVTPHDEVTDMNWPVKAAGLSDLLQRIARDYTSIPLMVTENGAAYADRKIEDRVADADRVSYLRRHIEALAVALDAGVDLRGYYLWSFMDNFEWAFGYSKRFGIVYLDYETQRRIPKDSAYWYRNLIREFHQVQS